MVHRVNIRFADKNIYFQDVPAFEKSKKYPQQRIANMINYRDFVFRICPKLNYEFHKEYKKSMKFYKKLKKLGDSLTNRQKQLKRNLDIKIIKLEERIDKEKEQNILIQQDNEGKLITYGSEIYLMHQDSMSFIKAKNDSAQTNKIGYDCTLSAWYSRSMTFKVLPKYKSRQDGEVIQYGDNVIFQNVKYTTYLSYTIDLKGAHDREIERTITEVFRMRQYTVDPLTEKYQAYLSQESEVAWQITLFRPYSSANHLKGTDLIRLRHTELNGYICASLKYSDKCNIYVRNYVGEFSEENYSSNSIWEIESNSIDSRGDSFKMIEKTQDEYNTNKLSESFRLRHFLSGCLFDNQPSSICYLNEGQKDIMDPPGYSLIEAEPILKNLKFLQQDYSYYISINGEYLQYDKNTESIMKRESLMAKMENQSFYKDCGFTPLNDDDFEEIRRPLIISTVFSSEDAFIIERLKENETKEILFVRSCLPLVKMCTYLFKSGATEELTSEVFMKLEKIFKELCFFLYEEQFSTDIDIFNYDKDPIPRRQKILKDMNIIEILIDIIYLPFANGLYKLKALDSTDLITSMLGKCYSTLRITIEEYRPNELYCSQWLNLIMDQALNTSKFNDIQAGVTFQELIDNNERILESRIEISTIKKFIAFLIRQSKIGRYVDILRAICICNNFPMIKNQKELSKLLIQDSETYRMLIFKLNFETQIGSTIGAGDVFVNKFNQETDEIMILQKMHKTESKNEWKALSHFKESELKIDEGQSYYYFISMTSLLSDLCVDKNYLSIEPLMKDFPFIICERILTDRAFPFDMREAFCNLTKNLWVNIHPYSELKLPKKVLIYDQINKDSMISSSVEDIARYTKLKSFICEYLEEFSSKEDNITLQKENHLKEESERSSDNDVEKFNYSVLSMCEKMIELGFFSSTIELNKVLSCIKGMLSYYLNEKQRRIIARENAKFGEKVIENEAQIVLECKQKICDIILKIIDIKNDYTIKLFIVHLKSKFDSIKKPSNSNDSKQRLIETTREDINSMIDSFEVNTKNVEELVKPIFTSNLVKDNSIDLAKEKLFMSYVFDLIVSDNDVLKGLALQILTKIYSQTQTLSHNLKGIIIILNQRDKSTWDGVKSRVKDLSVLCQNCEVWYTKKFSNEMTEVEEILQSFMRTKISPEGSKKSQDNLLDDPNTEAYILSSSDPDDEFFFTQNLLREAGVFDAILKLLNYDLKIDEVRTGKSPGKIRLLEIIYIFLAEQCIGNTENKELLTEKGLNSIFLKHFENSNYDYKTYFLLRELIKGNSKLISDSKKMETVMYCILKEIKSIDLLNIKKAICLDILSYSILDRGDSLKANQNYIVKKLFSHENERFVPKDALFIEIEKHAKMNRTFANDSILNRDGKPSVLNGKLYYFIALLKVLSVCGDGKSGFAENVGQNYIKIERLHQLLSIEGIDLLVKCNILNFYFHIYVDTEKLLPPYRLNMTHRIWKLLIQELESLSAQNSKLRNSFLTTAFFRIEGIIDGSVLLKRYMKLVVDSLSGLISKSILNHYPEYEHDMKDIRKALESVAIHHNDLLPQVEDLRKQVVTYLTNHDDHALRLKNKVEEVSGGDKTNLGRRTLSIEDINSDGTREYISQDALHESIILKGKLRQEKFKGLLAHIAGSEAFTVVCRGELNELSKLIENIESVTSSVHANIGFNEFAASLIAFLNPENEACDTENSILGLNIFRRYIEGANSKIDRPAAEWDVADWADCKTILEKRQNTLIDLNIIDLVCKMLRHNTSDLLKTEITLLSISLLLGGNKKAQTIFHKKLSADQENLVLVKLKSTIDSSFDYIKKKMTDDSDREFKKKLDARQIDRGQNLDGSSSDELYQYHLDITTKTYRFLQLLCEGHNIVLQNFLRKQSSNKMAIITNNINFISDTVFKFGSLIKVIDTSISDLVEQILDFLIEAIQGPCLNNQKQLFKSKMTDFIKDLLNDKFVDVTTLKSFEDIEEDMENWNQVIKKGVKLIISMFEGNDGREFVRFLAINMEFIVLVNKLAEELYRFFKKNYNMEIAAVRNSSLDSLNSRLVTLIFDDDMADAFDLYFCIVILDDMTCCYQSKIKELKGELELAFNFFKEHSAHIEIIFKGNIQKLYFIIQPACRYLSDKVKDDLMDSVKRDTPNDKLTDLMTSAPPLFDMMDHLSMLANGTFKISPRMFERIRIWALIYAFFMNFVIFILFKKRVEDNQSRLSEGFDNTHIIMRILGIIYAFFGMAQLILWFVIEGSLVQMDGWRLLFKDYKKYIQQNYSDEDENDQLILGYLSKNMIDITKKEIIKAIKYYFRKVGDDYVVPYVFYYTKTLLFMLSSAALRYILFYLIGSIYAILSGEPILYALFLLEVTVR